MTTNETSFFRDNLQLEAFRTGIIPKVIEKKSAAPDSNNKAVQIIYEDDDVFAAVKPAGVVMHADSHHPKGSFLEMVCTLRPTAQLLHRLDKDTSGVMIVARRQPSFEYLKKLFQDHIKISYFI